MLISKGEALVVDPVRDAFAYLETAKKEGVTIKGVYLTHSHADFVAGHMEIVDAVNCPIYQSKKSGARYPFEPVGDGDAIEIGNATVKLIETPGHTPDGMCALVYSKETPDIPELMFTGDVLFVGSVGRPDLMEGTVSASWLASAVFDSWTRKISKLGDGVMIFPAHGAGSLCGAHLSEEPFSTIGREKISNIYFKYNKRGEFIAALLEGLPEAPQYFKRNAALNKKGPPLVDWDTPMPAEISPRLDLSDPSKYTIVDLRNAEEYAAEHIPHAVNIGLRGRLETWVGIMVPWGTKIVLCGSEKGLGEALFRLHRVGYGADIITMESWRKAGLPVARSNPISPLELYELMEKGEAPVIVDVRLPGEWMALRIGTVLNLPLNHLAELSTQLDPLEPLVTVCNSAYRSSMAVGILEREGFKMPRNLEGGSEAWIQAGLPVHKSATEEGPVSSKQVRLPERISASELKRLMMDLPGTFELMDIRPPALFDNYNLPGSRNVDVAEIMSNPRYLVGIGPLILVDRDGSIAMAVGGVLSQKTERPIKVLYGGLEAYWSETQGMTGMSLSPQQPPPQVLTPSRPTRPGAAPPPAQKPARPKRKSAGC
jgi:glyoxylase-like metal-dependent hydrolase (beta-lactamase superfamily II)/rhodanese-related sulfurtransferase